MISEKQKNHLERLRLLNTGKPSKLKNRKREPFSDEWKKRMSDARKGKYYKKKVDKIENECLMCGIKKLFYQHEINRGRGKFCSLKCKYAWTSVNKSTENHWNWKGGITEDRNKLRNTLEYKKWRFEVFKRDNYTCVWCLKSKEVSGNLTADHIKPVSLHPELMLELSNGRTLCRECHYKTDTWGGKITKLKKQNAKNS